MAASPVLVCIDTLPSKHTEPCKGTLSINAAPCPLSSSRPQWESCTFPARLSPGVRFLGGAGERGSGRVKRDKAPAGPLSVRDGLPTTFCFVFCLLSSLAVLEKDKAAFPGIVSDMSLPSGERGYPANQQPPSLASYRGDRPTEAKHYSCGSPKSRSQRDPPLGRQPRNTTSSGAAVHPLRCPASLCLVAPLASLVLLWRPLVPLVPRWPSPAPPPPE